MIVIVDYGVGNLGSIINMLKKAGAKAIASSAPDVLQQAEKLILPGVGAFDAGMNRLHECGLVPLLNHLALEKKVPFLGLCLGLQLMTRRSGVTHCLELRAQRIVKKDIRFRGRNCLVKAGE